MSNNNGNGDGLASFEPHQDGPKPEQMPDPLAGVEPRVMSAEEKYDYAIQGLIVLAECLATIEDALTRGGLCLDALNKQLGPDAKARVQDAIAQPRIIIPR